MKRVVAATAMLLAVPSGAMAQTAGNPPFAAPTSDEVFVKLADTVGEPRGFCLDFPGFPVSGNVREYRESTWPLGLHTCKTGIEQANVATIDQLFSRAQISGPPGRLRFSRLNVCVEVLTFRGVSAPGHVAETSIRQDAPVVANACSAAAEQQFSLDAAGRIKPLADPTKCLTVGKEAFEAGDRTPGHPWYRRDVNFSACAPSAASRQTWRLVTPG